MDINKAIQNIIENFDYEKVRKVMVFLDWIWIDNPEPPTIGRMITSNSRYLKEVYDKCNKAKENYIIKTGGFAYKAYWDESLNKVSSVELCFELSSWEYYE